MYFLFALVATAAVELTSEEEVEFMSMYMSDYMKCTASETEDFYTKLKIGAKYGKPCEEEKLWAP